jgi:signal transduction histidine kinase
MNSPGLHSGRLEKWERRERPLFAALPYVMLAFSTVLTLAVRGSTGQTWLIDLGLCALTAAWMLCAYTLRPASRERPRAMAVFFAVLIALMTILVFRDPWFGFFTFTGYLYAVELPPGLWRVLGVATVAVLTGSSQAGGFPKDTRVSTLAFYFGIVAVNIVVSGAFTWFGWVGATQNERRRRLVEELSEVNRRLKATREENAGLHKQLLTQAREAGILDERQRMAREIHDTLAQGLTGIITQLQATETACDDPVARRRHFDAATRLARDSLMEARRSVDALRPQPLERARLGDALASVAERWSALHGVAAHVTVTGTARPMAADTEFALLRMAQESLANVARHAAATRVEVTLSYMEEEVALDVRDDGRGFDATRVPSGEAGAPAPSGRDRVPSGGFGLVAMRQRIEALSGTLQVESEPGSGTAISACVPFRAADDPGRAVDTPGYGVDVPGRAGDVPVQAPGLTGQVPDVPAQMARADR